MCWPLIGLTYFERQGDLLGRVGGMEGAGDCVPAGAPASAACHTAVNAAGWALLVASLAGPAGLRTCHRLAVHSMTKRGAWSAGPDVSDLFCHPGESAMIDP